MINYTTVRQNMVENQLRPAAILDARLLQAFQSVPREIFLPKAAAALAYSETAQPIGAGRFMLAPLCAAILLQTAEITANDVVLVIGAGDGYMGAIAARLAGTVIGVECDAALLASATAQLNAAGVDNIALLSAELPAGCPKQAPYDVIILNGATQVSIDPLLRQLRQGGRLVCIEYENAVGRARIYRRDGDSFAGRTVRDCTAPVLPGFEQLPAFSFG
ncbi:MAG: protein-L-isoaspartate O-methyltransferase family protein [Pseudomonadota bacterium]